MEAAWGGQPVQRQLAELKFKQVPPCARTRSVTSSNPQQEMDVRLEYDKAKAVKWLMAPGLIEISAEDIAAALAERNAREIARCPSIHLILR